MTPRRVTAEPDLWTGDDGNTAFLVTRWPDGGIDVAIRPAGSGVSWSPPVELRSAS